MLKATPKFDPRLIRPKSLSLFGLSGADCIFQQSFSQTLFFRSAGNIIQQIKWIVIETTGVCGVVTTLPLLRYTLIKFAIHGSIFPKRSGRILILRWPNRHQ